MAYGEEKPDCACLSTACLRRGSAARLQLPSELPSLQERLPGPKQVRCLPWTSTPSPALVQKQQSLMIYSSCHTAEAPVEG